MYVNDLEVVGTPSKERSRIRNEETTTKTELCWYHRTYGDKASRCRSPCAKKVRKRSESSVTATSTGGLTTRRIFMTDYGMKTQFLIDTGADVFVYPKDKVSGSRSKASYELYAPNGSPIATYGTIRLDLNFKLRRQYNWC
jgi:hypothetical protein